MPARQKYRGSPSYVVSNYADSLYLSSKISALVVDLLVSKIENPRIEDQEYFYTHTFFS